MKKLIYLLLFVPFVCSAATGVEFPYKGGVKEYLGGWFDDTSALQALLNSGNAVLTKSVYNVSSTLNLSGSLDLAGDMINYTGTGTCINLNSGSITSSISGGIIKGQSNTTNTSGTTGINLAGINVSVSHVRVSNFTAYGMVGTMNNPSVTYCTIDNIGYIPFFFDGEGGNTYGGTFTYNSLDNSMVTTSGEACAVIQGSIAGNGIAHKWLIQGNTFKALLNPPSNVYEGIEVRNCNNCRILTNTGMGGSIAISMVGMKNVHSNGNKAIGCNNEGFEFAGCINAYSSNDVVTGPSPIGYLLDGDGGCQNVTINNFTSNAALGVQVYIGGNMITLNNCNITCTTQAVYMTQAQNLTITNCFFQGGKVGNEPVELQTCPGGLVWNGGTVTGFTQNLVYCTSPSATTTNNLNTNDVSLTNTASGVGTYNVTLGSNVNVQ